MRSEKSSFGDVLINFIYSCAFSKTTKDWEGKRVSNSVLASALTLSKVQKPRRSSRQMLGNYVESFIAKAWVEGIVTTEECIDVLSYNLKEGEIGAFRNLIDYIHERSPHDKTTDTDFGH